MGPIRKELFLIPTALNLILSFHLFCCLKIPKKNKNLAYKEYAKSEDMPNSKPLSADVPYQVSTKERVVKLITTSQQRLAERLSPFKQLITNAEQFRKSRQFFTSTYIHSRHSGCNTSLIDFTTKYDILILMVW